MRTAPALRRAAGSRRTAAPGFLARQRRTTALKPFGTVRLKVWGAGGGSFATAISSDTRSAAAKGVRPVSNSNSVAPTL